MLRYIVKMLKPALKMSVHFQNTSTCYLLFLSTFNAISVVLSSSLINNLFSLGTEQYLGVGTEGFKIPIAIVFITFVVVVVVYGGAVLDIITNFLNLCLTYIAYAHCQIIMLNFK